MAPAPASTPARPRPRRTSSPSVARTLAEAAEPPAAEITDWREAVKPASALASTGPTRRRSAQREENETPARRAKIESSEDAELQARARGILLDQLAGRARSRKELADKLAAKEIPDEIAGELLDRFEQAGLVDDAEFARMWVQARQRTKGLARRALAHELRRKGVVDHVAAEALDTVDPDDEEEAARALVQRKLRSMSRLDDITKTRRLLGMLGRKGYSGSMAMTVIRSELRKMSESEA